MAKSPIYTGCPGINIRVSRQAIAIPAKQAVLIPPGIVYGLGNSGSLFLSFTREKAVIAQLITYPAAENVVNDSIRPLPINGPIRDTIKQTINALCGVPYLLSISDNLFGTILTRAIDISI